MFEKASVVCFFCLQAKDTEIRGTKFVVDGLKEGGLYSFRVRAVNAAGVGDPGLVSELIEVKDRTSECPTCSELKMSPTSEPLTKYNFPQISLSSS